MKLKLSICRVVVGVKFILHDNAIHLQIQQAKISKDFTIVDEGSWKPVDIDENNNTINIAYETMFDRRSIFYLDDVLVDPDYVVTGNSILNYEKSLQIYTLLFKSFINISRC